MKKTEIYLYLKTMLFNFGVGLILVIPSSLVMGVVLGIFYGIDISTLDEYNTNLTVFIAEFILTIIISIPINILTGRYFFNKAKGLEIKKVLNNYVKIGVGINILFLITDILLTGFNLYSVVLTVESLILFLIIFRNVVINQGNFNFKRFK